MVFFFLLRHWILVHGKKIRRSLLKFNFFFCFEDTVQRFLSVEKNGTTFSLYKV